MNYKIFGLLMLKIPIEEFTAGYSINEFTIFQTLLIAIDNL